MTGLCAWVINIIKFYEVYCDVEPKRRALAQANAELAQAQDKLSVIKRKVAVSINLNYSHIIKFIQTDEFEKENFKFLNKPSR